MCTLSKHSSESTNAISFTSIFFKYKNYDSFIGLKDPKVYFFGGEAGLQHSMGAVLDSLLTWQNDHGSSTAHSLKTPQVFQLTATNKNGTIKA